VSKLLISKWGYRGKYKYHIEWRCWIHWPKQFGDFKQSRAFPHPINLTRLETDKWKLESALESNGI
jgi:hypothetical protein